eukprot:m.32199 g.32199  ORF g.32199 m.32199 type:complete len:98 (+) comp8383_c0_seq1:199-492(+)
MLFSRGSDGKERELLGRSMCEALQAVLISVQTTPRQASRPSFPPRVRTGDTGDITDVLWYCVVSCGKGGGVENLLNGDCILTVVEVYDESWTQKSNL